MKKKETKKVEKKNVTIKDEEMAKAIFEADNKEEVKERIQLCEEIDEDFIELKEKKKKYNFIEPLFVFGIIILCFLGLYHFVFASRLAIVHSFLNGITNDTLKLVQKTESYTFSIPSSFTIESTINEESSTSDKWKNVKIQGQFKNNEFLFNLNKENTQLLELSGKVEDASLILEEDHLSYYPISIELPSYYNKIKLEDLENGLINFKKILYSTITYKNSTKAKNTLDIDNENIKVKELKINYSKEESSDILNSLFSELSKKKEFTNYLTTTFSLTEEEIQSYLTKKIDLTTSSTLSIYTTGLLDDFIGFQYTLDNGFTIEYTNYKNHQLTITNQEKNIKLTWDTNTITYKDDIYSLKLTEIKNTENEKNVNFTYTKDGIEYNGNYTLTKINDKETEIDFSFVNTKNNIENNQISITVKEEDVSDLNLTFNDVIPIKDLNEEEKSDIYTRFLQIVLQIE